MSIAGFHPVIAGWFGERFGTPTEAQRRGWAAIRSGQHTLIAAPTGSGKTLAAFLTAVDDLLREGIEKGELPDETRVLYVSPLKALSADIHRNLAEPRREIQAAAESLGLSPVRITAAVRTGDTAAGERASMLRRPPHILVTTPESLFLLLTAERSRELLRTVRTVIVDEVHAVLESRRGSHLALSLERLDHVVGRRVQRIGLSATQKPIEEVARFLTGADPDCRIVDEGHLRETDLAIELTGSPLGAVLSNEAWDEFYDRLAELIRAHRTTLVFVNTRRLAERVSRHLAERLGVEAVIAHHGSLSKEARLAAEARLKGGNLQALVATASLELGIDIGHVDLVCQLGSPRRIATLLQRVGRSGHSVGGTPKGRLFPLTRSDLVECAALLTLVRRGALDRAILEEKPLDVLAQQVVAEAAAEDWNEAELFALMRRAWPYRELTAAEFEEVVEMVSTGFVTRRGRRGAFVHRDRINGRVRGRRGARMLALTSGGAIPEVADYAVVVEPEELRVGTLNEDFAIESSAGDVFQLGNRSWRVLRVLPGVVRVADAGTEPPNIPFWLGEAPARSAELSTAVSELRLEIGSRLGTVEKGAANGTEPGADSTYGDAIEWLVAETGLPPAAAWQLVHYLAESKRLLGVLPSQRTLVLERFFDDSGGMQLVLHAPFGSRVNRAWGLALRKKFCRTYNFELQAAATDEGVLLSLGPQHSFPLDDVFRYLTPEIARNTLIQAVLDAPLFLTRWRWATNLSLAVPRSRSGRKVPPPLQRMQADDLLAAAFPDAAACLENIGGDRDVPDHPLVRQTIRDCLELAMDLPGLEAVLRGIRDGELEVVARDTPEPSTLATQLLAARVYEFLDDAPLEERRAHAVRTRRALEPSSANDLGALDEAAIARVRAEAWPAADDADELHDALLTSAFLTAGELMGGGGGAWSGLLDELVRTGRAAELEVPAGRVWVATERLAELLPLSRPDADRSGAVVAALRGRVEIIGPVTGEELGAPLGLAASEVEAALLALEADGVVLRGYFTPGRGELEWCHRRLLARIHRYTLDRLRAEIEPVSAADFMRFLFRWQRVEPGEEAAGIEGLQGIIAQLDGFEAPAAAWEADILPARVGGYAPELLDSLCMTGRVAWGRLTGPTGSASGGAAPARPLRTSPIAILLRENAARWLSLARGTTPGRAERPAASEGAALPKGISSQAREVLSALERRGACFFGEIAAEARLLPTHVEAALAELAAAGLVTADSFGGLRALLTPQDRRSRPGGRLSRRRAAPWSVETAGRWAVLAPPRSAADAPVRGGLAGATAGSAAIRSIPGGAARKAEAEAVEMFALALLRRYGVIFRRLLVREPLAPPWRELVLVYRRLEARGEIRGGRFVAGFGGEQFALPEGVSALRAIRRRSGSGQLVAISAADPLNLVGIVTPGDRVPALAGNRVLYRDGVPVAVREGGRSRNLAGRPDAGLDPVVARSLVRRPIPPSLRVYLRPAR